MNWNICPNQTYANELFELVLNFENIESSVFLDVPTNEIKALDISGNGQISFHETIHLSGEYTIEAYDVNFSIQASCEILVIDSIINFDFNRFNMSVILNNKNISNVYINQMNNSFYRNNEIFETNDYKLVCQLLGNNEEIIGCLKGCSNNGVCIKRSAGIPKCECYSGYIGRNCETSLRPCLTKQCLNNGKCIEFNTTSSNASSNNLSYDFKCECNKNFYGTRCENTVDLCTNRTCLNGLCFYNETLGDSQCKCFQYYSGSNCEIESIEITVQKKVIAFFLIVCL